MNIYFSKVIKAGERQREFNFRQLSIHTDHSYFVDVPDDKGQRVSFTMKQVDEGQWQPEGDHLPAWIQNTVSDISAAIAEHTEGLPVKKKK
ncbi:MAG TPA: hypothetical protein VEY32_03285 [Flavisolibacter sp.]|jgi:hypothetical protein|nr:hypothetical protein [Flavisolibacter sp.]